ncbi:MAG: DUF4136 domain-containing protein [bacterium]
MKVLRFFLCFSLTLGLMSCSSITVKSDYDRQVNFANYQTFKWMPYPAKAGKSTVAKNSLLDKRIRRAVERELSAKGYEIVQTGKADAALAYHTAVRQKVDVSGVGYGYWRGWPRGRRVYVHSYKEGTLVVDIVDPDLKQLIWRGLATDVVDDPEESEEKINEAVKKILERFPPQ